MRRRIKKFQKIAGFFEQKKNIRVAELHRASVTRIRRARELSLFVRKKENHDARFIDSITGNLKMSDIAYVECAREYFERGMHEFRVSLDAAERNELDKRKAVARASVTHRTWEELVSRIARRHLSRETIRGERISDDLAVVRSVSKGRST
jgi:hypothetical protein